MGSKKFNPSALTGCLLIFLLSVDLVAAVDVAPGQPLVDEVSVQAALTKTAILEISIEDQGAKTWNLSPGASNRRDIVVRITANTPWELKIADTNPQTSGHLTEWTGQAYTNKRLTYPLKVRGSRDVTLPNSQNVAVLTGASTSSQGRRLGLSLEQDVTPDDESLQQDHIYRIQLTFTLVAEKT
ncbi:Uncharacterised protein [uncultured archaeon]|nr:Uncharacterised protein [uncultured archaeon]